MKAYLIATGIIFGLITVAHIWRAFAEGSHLATDPVFILLTLLSTALCIWACRLFRTLRTGNLAIATVRNIDLTRQSATLLDNVRRT